MESTQPALLLKTVNPMLQVCLVFKLHSFLDGDQLYAGTTADYQVRGTLFQIYLLIYRCESFFKITYGYRYRTVLFVKCN